MLKRLHASWKERLADEFQADYWDALECFVDAQRSAHPDRIYPPEDQVFAALESVSYESVRVVILGQDPYHRAGQAHGFSFSVPRGVVLPPSLRNIFQELRSDVGCQLPTHGSLEAWAKQGVLLLNTVLTVRDGEANSHRKQGWERFTDAVIHRLAQRDEPVVYVLWGASAIKKSGLIDRPQHVTIQSPHPSPLSARRGFFGSRPFSQVNGALQGFGQPTIDWCIS